jgi:hypothetical protein
MMTLPAPHSIVSGPVAPTSAEDVNLAPGYKNLAATITAAARFTAISAIASPLRGASNMLFFRPFFTLSGQVFLNFRVFLKIFKDCILYENIFERGP